MCACDEGRTCPACQGSRRDDRYLDDEPETREERTARVGIVFYDPLTGTTTPSYIEVRYVPAH